MRRCEHDVHCRVIDDDDPHRDNHPAPLTRSICCGPKHTYGDEKARYLNSRSDIQSPCSKHWGNCIAVKICRRPCLAIAVVIDDIADYEKRKQSVGKIEQRLRFSANAFKCRAPENLVHSPRTKFFQALPNCVMIEKRGRI